MLFLFFFFNDTATTEIYTLSLHDALPISADIHHALAHRQRRVGYLSGHGLAQLGNAEVTQSAVVDDVIEEFGVHIIGQTVDRKSTRLNSSHANISYAVFCLKKKNTHIKQH